LPMLIVLGIIRWKKGGKPMKTSTTIKKKSSRNEKGGKNGAEGEVQGDDDNRTDDRRTGSDPGARIIMVVALGVAIGGLVTGPESLINRDYGATVRAKEHPVQRLYYRAASSARSSRELAQACERAWPFGREIITSGYLTPTKSLH